MIHYCGGTVFNTPADALVNTVNCVGVMGAGIALEFKLRYPKMYKQYRLDCENHKVYVGRLKLYEENNIKIINFPTKKHWRSPSKIDYIEEGLKYFKDNYEKLHIKSIAFPKLGTGKGGLDWNDVQKLMENYLSNIDLDIYICLDGKKEAEGQEREMISLLNSVDSEELINELNLNQEQVNLVLNSIPLDRFWKLSKAKGIDDKLYSKIFKYFYNKTTSIKNEQLSFL